MKSWIYIFDHEDLCSVVDMVESTGTSYIPSIEHAGVGDCVFVATNEYDGRILYMLTISNIKGYVADDGEVLFDTVTDRGMLIVDKLLLSSLNAEGLSELEEGKPIKLADEFAKKLKCIFSELDDYGDERAIDVKLQIIREAKMQD